MATLSENAIRVVNALRDIKQAIINKGVTPSGNCETFADAIDSISTGTDVSDTTATADDVTSDSYFYNSSGVKTRGNIDKQGELNIELSSVYQVAHPSGYYDGITAKIVPNDINNLRPENIRSNVNILGVTGTLEGGSKVVTGSFTNKTATSTLTTITVGFRPKVIILILRSTTHTNKSIPTFWYNEDVSTTNGYYGMTVYALGNTSTGRIIREVTDTGFGVNGFANYQDVFDYYVIG